MNRKKLSGLSGILLSAPIAIATLSGCAFNYGGKKVMYSQIKKEYSNPSNKGETSKKIAGFIDHDKDGDIDAKDIKWEEGNLRWSVLFHVSVDLIRRGYHYVQNAYQSGRVPLLNSQRIALDQTED